MALPNLDESALVAQHLPGEPVIWTGRPDPVRVAFVASGILLFAIPWTTLAMWQGSRISQGQSAAPGGSGPFGLSLFALPFVVIGVGMCLSPLYKAWRARRTLFAITRSRLVVLRPKLSGGVEFESYAGSHIHDIRLSTRPDGTGDLIVAVGWARDSEGARQEKRVEMRGITDVQRAHEALEALRRSG